MQLNAIQEVMASHLEGPALIFAVAGSGKTTGIVNRISRMYQSGIDPGHILATTFNKDASEEIKKRLKKSYGSIVDRAPIRTTHSLGYEICRATGIRMEEIDEWKAKKVLKDKLKKIKGKIRPGEEKDMLTIIGFMKNHLAWFEDVPGLPFYWNMQHAITKMENGLGTDGEVILKCYEEYETYKMKENLIDKDDMLFKAYWALMTKPDLLKHYQEKYRFMIVDEYQDTNEAQYQIFKLLAAIHNNFMAVGDDDQSIYGFRGSCPQYIQTFKDDYPDAIVVALEQNYRSQAGIVVAANELVSRNKFRQEKTLISTIDHERKPIHVRCSNNKTEAKFIAENISCSGFQPSEIAILTRTNAQQCLIEDALIEKEIPYYVMNNTPFFKRKEIASILSYLKIAEGSAPEDEIMDEIKLMATRPYRKLPKDEIMRWTTMESMMRMPNGYAYYDQLMLLRKAFELAKDNMAIVVNNIIDYPINLIWWVQQDGTIESDSNAKKNMEAFMDLCRQMTYAQLMEKIAKCEKEYAKMESKRDGVAICTMHAAKGLEWNEVYIAGMNMGLMPHKNSVDIEEERRLGYVAVTRAKKFLVITSYEDEEGTDRSMFIDEMGDKIEHDYVQGVENVPEKASGEV